MDEQTAEPTSRRGWLKLAGAGALGAAGATVAAATPALAAPGAFHVINPYRVLDTRQGLPLQAPSRRDVNVRKDIFGHNRIPSGAAAVAYNLTITRTTRVGYLALFPANIVYPGTSSINWWTDGIEIANGGIVKVGPSPVFGPCSLGLRCFGTPGARVHCIIDITGWIE
jgi:hypothetical protein